MRDLLPRNRYLGAWGGEYVGRLEVWRGSDLAWQGTETQLWGYYDWLTLSMLGL